MKTRSSCTTSQNQPIYKWQLQCTSYTVEAKPRWIHNVYDWWIQSQPPQSFAPGPFAKQKSWIFFAARAAIMLKKYAPAIERNRKRVRHFFLHTSPLWRGLRSWASRSRASRRWASRSWARKYGNITYSFVFLSIFLLPTLKRCLLEWVRLGRCKSWSLFYIIPGLNQRQFSFLINVSIRGCS